jgi:pimeloyl-ACP methyl ester carboxylesterase
MWFHLIAALEDRYRIIAPDMPRRSLTLAETNAALIKLLDREGINRAITIGYSAGGGLAQAFTQAHPERVQHLILSHCTPLDADTAHRMDRMAKLLSLLPLSFIRAVLMRRSSRYPVTSEWADFTRAFFAGHIATLNKADLTQFIRSGVEAARAFQFDGQALQNWNGRIVLMSSRDDATTFPRLAEMQARYPTSQMHIFEQGGHHTLLLYPETYDLILADFLDELE